MQVGEAAIDQAAHEVDRHRRAHMAFEQTQRIGNTRRGGEVRRIDQIAAIARQRDAVPGFQISRARLGVLTRKTTDAHDALAHAVHEYQGHRSEEHTSELQSLMRISYAVFCLKKKTKNEKS